MERFLISGHGFSAEVTNSFGADILSLKYDGGIYFIVKMLTEVKIKQIAASIPFSLEISFATICFTFIK